MLINDEKNCNFLLLPRAKNKVLLHLHALRGEATSIIVNSSPVNFGILQMFATLQENFLFGGETF